MDTLGRIDKFIQEIDRAQNVEDVAAALRAQVDLLGFERFSYQVLRTNEGSRPKYYITGYPKEWTKVYVERNYVSNDMVSRHAARTVRPFSWLEIGRYEDFTKDQKEVFGEAAAFGIKNGGTVPIHGPGTAKALFTVASALPDEEFAKLFASCQHELHLVATYAHEKLYQLGLHSPLPTTLKLTPREIEVLTWTARGKTAWEVSQVLSISEDTVKAHLERTCAKLNTTNKTHATAVSLINGLIVP